MEPRGVLWYSRFRAAALLCAAVAVLWTVAIILPFDPFSSLLPIMIGGGAGTWFLLGYGIYVAVGIGGLAGLSSLLAILELTEDRTLNGPLMWAGLVMLFVGVNASCILLGLAGASGGYAQTIQHLPEASLEIVLSPYIDVTRVTSAIAILGAIATLLGVVTAGREKRPE